jgi:hypothetical protein
MRQIRSIELPELFVELAYSSIRPYYASREVWFKSLAFEAEKQVTGGSPGIISPFFVGRLQSTFFLKLFFVHPAQAALNSSHLLARDRRTATSTELK